MEGKPGTRTVCGIEIPAEQRTPLVEALLRVIEQLQSTVQQQQRRIEQLEDEVRRLKGLPEKPKRKPGPSSLNDPSGPPSAAGEKKKPNTSDGKRPGSAKRSKTPLLVIHDDVPLPLDGLPDGTKFLGYQDFTVQDLKVEPHNTRYRRCRYQLPDGTIVTAPLPKDVTSHFGPTLRQYTLYQHFHNHVTQPLLYEELCELGIDISVGQVNRLLTEGHDAFHEEKDRLLGVLFLGLAAMMLATMALIALTALVAIAFWDTYRWQSLAGITAVYAIAALICAIKARSGLHSSPMVFEATLAEFEKDREIFRKQ